MARTSAEELIGQGREIGKAIGKEIGQELGRVAAKRETLLGQMRQKFSVLPSTLEEQVLKMEDSSRLDDLLVRILTASSPMEMGL